MIQNPKSILKNRLDEENYDKLTKINNPALHQFVAQYIELCMPDSVFVSSDRPEDADYIREQAIVSGEEKPLTMPGHTVHFDGYYDQGRDKGGTRFLVSLAGTGKEPGFNTIERTAGYREIELLLKNIMCGHKMYVLFFSLGPTGSDFSIPNVQITDSAYVAHSEQILYRHGYEQFLRLKNPGRFFKFVHSEGELDGCVSKNIDKRRVYVDTSQEIVFSVNTQYGGNTIGLKKLAMRLAINRASQEGWLTEHMFIMGVGGPKDRVTYFTGAFPSLCGKTSTSMVEGETIIGDDIAYLKKRNGQARAVNVEKGIFGIIQGINSREDKILWETLNRPAEIIYSNVLMTEGGQVYWIGKDGTVPNHGFNHSGEWHPGKTDSEGKEIPASHPNARLTVALSELPNVDPELDNPNGVPIGGIIYGGRDSDTSVPVEESFDWAHGIVTKGASLESETTAATLGKQGIRRFNPMSNLDFLSIPISRYVKNNLDFGAELANPPRIFSVNYFLKDTQGEFLNQKNDKRIWLKWMELRLHGEVAARRTPTGLIPLYEDLGRLFQEVLGYNYTVEEYKKQFTLRIPENLAKVERIMNIYKTEVADTLQEIFKILTEQQDRLKQARQSFGDYVSPEKFEIEN